MSDASEGKVAEHPAVRVLQIVLAVALLAALFFAGWRIYRHLPASPQAATQVNESGPQTELTILMHGAADDTTVELYPIDFAAMQNEFRTSGRPGKTFEEFFNERLKKFVPVRVRFNNSGRAVAQLGAGNWWLRARSSGPNEEVNEWRLPVVISQRAVTIELSADNAYERTKKF